MGSSKKVSYIVKYQSRLSPRTNLSCWDRQTMGTPNQQNLERWREGYNRSFLPGECNSHLTSLTGVVEYIYAAQLIHQKTNNIIASVVAPPFEVI